MKGGRLLDPDSGNAFVKILTNEPGRLIAQQIAPDSIKQGASGTIAIVVVVAIALAIYLYRIKYWQGLLLPIGMVVIVVSWLRPIPLRSWQMEMSQSTATIDFTAYSNDKVLSQGTVAFQDISSAEMQFHRGSTRVALILKDGTQVLPLGDYHIQDAPNHYVILTAIRNAIGQVPGR